jgi:CRISPR/Cas system CSM-associated protein Csm5 (group 7 of RAMP superfamily)
MTLANGKPVIPGSSIKGSLRTAVYKQLLSDGKFPTDQYSNLKGKMASDSFLAKLFSPNTPQKESPMNFDLGRAIRVFDGTVESSSCNAFNAYVFNSTTEGGKWKNSSSRRNVDRLSDATPISFIGLRPGSVPTKIEISLDNQIATNIGSPAILQTWSGLRKMNQDLAGLLYDSEYNYFDRFESTEVGKKILDQLSIVLDAIEENRPDDKIQWVQRIGWGSGWTSITADSISDADFLRQVRLKLGLGKVRKNKELNTFEILADEFPKTRKLVHFQDEIWTMGWIKVTEV